MGGKYEEDGFLYFGHISCLIFFLLLGLVNESKALLCAYLLFLFFWFVLGWRFAYAWVGTMVGMAIGVEIFR